MIASGTTTRDAGARAGQAWQLLAVSGSRRTVARALVIDALAAVDGHLSVTAIHERIAADHPEINISTVHRTVAFLVEHYVAHVLPWPGEALYGLNDQPHHHAVCAECGTIAEIPATALATAVAAAEQSSAFQINDAGLTLTGRCATCRGRTPPA